MSRVAVTDLTTIVDVVSVPTTSPEMSIRSAVRFTLPLTVILFPGLSVSNVLAPPAVKATFPFKAETLPSTTMLPTVTPTL